MPAFLDLPHSHSLSGIHVPSVPAFTCCRRWCRCCYGRRCATSSCHCPSSRYHQAQHYHAIYSPLLSNPAARRPCMFIPCRLWPCHVTPCVWACMCFLACRLWRCTGTRSPSSSRSWYGTTYPIHSRLFAHYRPSSAPMLLPPPQPALNPIPRPHPIH